MKLGYWLGIIAMLIVCLWAAKVFAAPPPVTFFICDSPIFTQKGDNLAITCPGVPAPVMNIKGCVGAKIKRVGVGAASKFTLTCTTWNRYDLVPSK